jgi:hypothetical protein
MTDPSQPRAVKTDLGPPIDPAGAEPLVMVRGHSAAVVYQALSRDCEHSPDAESNAPHYGWIIFEHPRAVSVGPPSDESLDGHPLYQHGLGPYRAHIVEDSPWPGELEALEPDHSLGGSERLRESIHYLLTFQDETFECLGTRWTLDGCAQIPLADILADQLPMVADEA